MCVFYISPARTPPLPRAHRCRLGHRTNAQAPSTRRGMCARGGDVCGGGGGGCVRAGLMCARRGDVRAGVCVEYLPPPPHTDHPLSKTVGSRIKTGLYCLRQDEPARTVTSCTLISTLPGSCYTVLRTAKPTVLDKGGGYTRDLQPAKLGGDPHTRYESLC